MISDQGVRGATFPEKPHLPPWNSANAKARRAARTTSNGLLPIDACLSGVAKWCFEQITNSFVKVFFSGSKKGHNAFSSNRWLATTTFPTYQNRRNEFWDFKRVRKILQNHLHQAKNIRKLRRATEENLLQGKFPYWGNQDYFLWRAVIKVT